MKIFQWTDVFIIENVAALADEKYIAWNFLCGGNLLK